jgi:hypothetical protein
MYSVHGKASLTTPCGLDRIALGCPLDSYIQDSYIQDSYIHMGSRSRSFAIANREHGTQPAR